MDKPSLREDRVSDEIDLRVVFQKLASFFRRISNKIRKAIALIFRWWPLVLFLTLVGIGGSYLVFQSKRLYYSSSITLAPAQIRNEFFEGQVSRLADLVADGNTAQVGSDLKITQEEASKLKALLYVNDDLEKFPKDSVLVGDPFRIDVQVYDPAYFIPFEQVLVGYFERNTYFSKSTQARKEQVRSTIAKLKKDIASIDSVKRMAVTPKGPVNGFVYGEPLDPTNLYKQSAALFETQAELEAELQTLETVQVVIGFAPLVHATGPKLRWHLLAGALVGLFLSYVIAQWLENRQKRRKADPMAG